MAVQMIKGSIPTTSPPPDNWWPVSQFDTGWRCLLCGFCVDGTPPEVVEAAKDEHRNSCFVGSNG